MTLEERLDKKIDELTIKLDNINDSLREEHRVKPLRLSTVIRELNLQYREVFYALNILEGIKQGGE